MSVFHIRVSLNIAVGLHGGAVFHKNTSEPLGTEVLNAFPFRGYLITPRKLRMHRITPTKEYIPIRDPITEKITPTTGIAERIDMSHPTTMQMIMKIISWMINDPKLPDLILNGVGQIFLNRSISISPLILF